MEEKYRELAEKHKKALGLLKDHRERDERAQEGYELEDERTTIMERKP